MPTYPIAATFSFFLLAASGSVSIGQSPNATPTEAGRQIPPVDSISRFLDSIMVEHDVPGLAFATFGEGVPRYEYVAGVKNRLTGEPVNIETTFEAASISKPVFAYIVLTLARDGLLSLDAPLAEFGRGVPDLAYDARSAMLTPRMLLSHLGGLPNWRSRLNLQARTHEELFAADDTLRFVSDPGTRYQYSGEGYVLLQRAVEHLAGKDLMTLAREIVFEPLGMTRSSFLYDSHVRTNTTSGHRPDGEPDKWEIAVPLASSTLHTTASDLERFGEHLAREIRSGGHYAVMAAPSVPGDEVRGIRRNWGLGLGVLIDEVGTYVYHGGNNVIFIADFIYLIDEDRGYALLTNSANGQRIVESVEQYMFGKDLPR